MKKLVFDMSNGITYSINLKNTPKFMYQKISGNVYFGNEKQLRYIAESAAFKICGYGSLSFYLHNIDTLTIVTNTQVIACFIDITLQRIQEVFRLLQIPLREVKS